MTAPTELLHKLQIQSGDRLWLINAPRHIAEELSAGAEVQIVHESDPHEGVVAFLDSPGEVEALAPRLMAGLPRDGLLWVLFRRGEAGRAAGLTSEESWQPLVDAGWNMVRQIAIDEEWSGLRFSPN